MEQQRVKGLTFITGNEGKAQYVREYCEVSLKRQKLDLLEIQSLSLQEVVEDKARRAFEQIKAPVLVEDVSLTFHALDRLPGPLIKWFLESLGNEGLCHLLDGYADRSARAQVLFALFDGENTRLFQGRKEGEIATKPRGTAGYGWDSIFIPKGYDKTWAEMDEKESGETSMRKEALSTLQNFLQ